MKTVLVTDPEQRASLSAARALSAAGYRVVSAGASRGLTGFSRWVHSHVTIPQTVGSEAGAYFSAIRQIVVDRSVDVIVPVSDVASRALLGNERLLGVPVAGPTADAYRRASDKALVMELAASVGLAAPLQVVVTSPDDVDHLGDLARGPVVLKPACSIAEVDGVPTKQPIRYANSADELLIAVRAYSLAAYPLLIQQRVLGEGVGVFLMREGGTSKLSFAHRRIREKPPSGGVSTYRESIAVPAPLLDSCERLLDALKYEGAAMVEFKREAGTGIDYLMEINARLWGSLQLSVDAGLDFPSALVAHALGEPIITRSYRLGVRTVWELGEVDHALSLLRADSAKLNLPSGSMTGWRAAFEALRSRRLSDHAEVFHWSDPVPFFAECAAWVGALLPRRT